MNVIDSCPFHSMTIRPPIPKIQFDLDNSRSKVKVKGTPVSAASFWLISLVFHTRASYRLLSLSFHDNRASRSRDTIWPWKFKVKGTPVSAASIWLIPVVFHIRASYRLPSLSFLTIGPPIPEIQFELENSRSRVKVKGTLVSVASSWLISFLFHIDWTNHS